jgi:alkylation response protein AidB-like acyl-CoA dehydrogenase
MDFAVSAEHQRLLDSFDQFVDRELAPLETDADWLRQDRVPDDIARLTRRRSAEHGFYGAGFPADVGGTALDPVGVVLLRMHAAGTGSRLALLAVPGPEGPTRLLLVGTDSQRQSYLRPLVEGRATRCLALTEATAGSDASALSTWACPTEQGWVLNGTKCFVTNGAGADVALVLAATGEVAPGAEGPPPISVFLVPKGTPGVRVVREMEGLWGGDPRFELSFESCALPWDAVLGGQDGVGLGMYQTLDNLSFGRLTIAATCVGLARHALNLAIDRARTRRSFGTTIGQHQHVQAHLVDSRLRVDTAELLVLRAAWRQAHDTDTAADSAMAKLWAAEGAFAVVDSALQVHGGLGYTRDLPLERMLRQVRLYRIVDGTSELLKVLIARSELGL